MNLSFLLAELLKPVEAHFALNHYPWVNRPPISRVLILEAQFKIAFSSNTPVLQVHAVLADAAHVAHDGAGFLI